MTFEELKDFLDHKADLHNRIDFIENDPIRIPHRFSRRQDIEIAGLFAAVLAWGQRATIIQKCDQLLAMTDNDPYNFVMNCSENELKPFTDFKHRTFNGTDALWFLHFLREYYQKYDSLEDLALIGIGESDTIFGGIQALFDFFSGLPDFPARTAKHFPNPARKSACKRLCMYFRWMVRRDNCGVDFGIWNRISPAKLICPLDVHTGRTGRLLGLLNRTADDRAAAEELTAALRKFDPADPVRYDFALFGFGLEMKEER